MKHTLGHKGGTPSKEAYFTKETYLIGATRKINYNGLIHFISGTMTVCPIFGFCAFMLKGAKQYTEFRCFIKDRLLNYCVVRDVMIKWITIKKTLKCVSMNAPNKKISIASF